MQIELGNLQKCLYQYLAYKSPLKDSGDDGDDNGYLTPNIGHRLRPILEGLKWTLGQIYLLSGLGQLRKFLAL